MWATAETMVEPWLHDGRIEIDGQAFGERVTRARPGDAQHGPAVALVGDGGQAGERRAQAGLEAAAGFSIGGGEPVTGAGPDEGDGAGRSTVRCHGQVETERLANLGGERKLGAATGHDGGKRQIVALAHGHAGRPHGAVVAEAVHQAEAGRVRQAINHAGALPRDR